MYSAEEIIKLETKPALGCTEPAAIALNAAFINDVDPQKTEKINITINTNLAKNAMYVPIPNTNRQYGIKLAYALGLICADKKNGLEIFKNVNEKCLQKAKLLEKKIELNITQGSEIFIKSVIQTDKDVLSAVSEKYHDNVVFVEKNGKKTFFEGKNVNTEDIEKMEKWLKRQTFETLFGLVEKMKNFDTVKKCIQMNMKLAEYGLEHQCGLGIGKKIKSDTLLSKINAYTAAASDTRMEGVNLNAMSVAGSGNHGIASSVPVYVFGKEKNFSSEEIYKAAALSMLVTVYIKLYTGRLSPLCGAAFASGCGSAAGMIYMETKDLQKVIKGIEYTVQMLAGIVCEGAKMGCSLKVLQASQSAYNAYLFAKDENTLPADGILGSDLQTTFANMEKITKSMMPVDNSIVEIMKEKIIQGV